METTTKPQRVPLLTVQEAKADLERLVEIIIETAERTKAGESSLIQSLFGTVLIERSADGMVSVLLPEL